MNAYTLMNTFLWMKTLVRNIVYVSSMLICIVDCLCLATTDIRLPMYEKCWFVNTYTLISMYLKLRAHVYPIAQSWCGRLPMYAQCPCILKGPFVAVDAYVRAIAYLCIAPHILEQLQKPSKRKWTAFRPVRRQQKVSKNVGRVLRAPVF